MEYEKIRLDYGEINHRIIALTEKLFLFFQNKKEPSYLRKIGGFLIRTLEKMCFKSTAKLI